MKYYPKSQLEKLIANPEDNLFLQMDIGNDSRKPYIGPYIKTIDNLYYTGESYSTDVGENKELIRINDKVELIFKSTEQEKVALFEQSDVFVMPSVVYKKSVEGFGITYIEAASYGKPSIGGVYGGESDAIKIDQTGYLSDGNDLNDLYETFLKILDNDKYKKLGANALEFSKNFDWNKVIKKYIELI